MNSNVSCPTLHSSGKCTLRALKQPKDILCPFHFGNTPLWYAASRRIIPDAEMQFMQVIEATPGGGDWCHQVRADFNHRGDFDFWNWRRNAYLQIDEARHWEGMTAYSHTKQSRRDFACNMAAYQACAAVVRVHAADIPHPTSIYAAMEAALYHRTIVLSTSYQCVCWTQGDCLLSYASILQQHLGEACSTFQDTYGNMVFLRGDAPTV